MFCVYDRHHVEAIGRFATLELAKRYAGSEQWKFSAKHQMWTSTEWGVYIKFEEQVVREEYVR